MKPKNMTPKQQSDFEFFMNSMAELGSSNGEVATEYLKEDGVDVDKVVGEGQKVIRRILAEERNQLAEQKRNQSMGIFERFRQWLSENGTLGNLQFEALQVNFRGLESLDEEEKARITTDALFLQFLEEVEEEYHE